MKTLAYACSWPILALHRQKRALLIVARVKKIVDLKGFKAYFEGRSLPFLIDAKVDYSADRMGGQLTIRAPNSKMPQVNADSSLEDRINYVLYNDVNPSLASHGGNVTLVEITDDMYAILKFGGGCQGCGSVETGD
jgi:Fe/S biogenesis protein NfuA